MATKLTKPIYRETNVMDQTPVILGVEPTGSGDMLTFRAKGTRTTYAIPLWTAYRMAVQAEIESRRTRGRFRR